MPAVNDRLRPRFIGWRKNAGKLLYLDRLVTMPQPGNCTMKSEGYDIIRKENNESAIWLEVAPDLKTAESRIHQLSNCWPGEFQILDQQTHQIVDIIVSSPSRIRGRH